MMPVPPPGLSEIEDDHFVRANQAWIRTLSGEEPDIELKSGARQCLRARADRKALWSHYHDPECHQVLLPPDPGPRAFLLALEQGRVWAAGARKFPGVSENLAKDIAGRIPDLSPGQQLAALAFLQLTQGDTSRVDAWDAVLSPCWPGLMHLISDQAAFGRKIISLLETSPNVRALADKLPVDPVSADPFQGLPLLPDSDEQTYEKGTPVPDISNQEPLPGRDGHDFGHDYRAYATAFDGTVQAQTLVLPEDLTRYHRELERDTTSYRPTATRLARRLMRRIMARQRCRWDFDQEEGVLNPKRLAGLMANPENHRIFMQESQSPFPATVVSLLIDNSGSMKGRPIRLAALTTGILAGALERCGVKTEILGYTTAAWNGGRSGQCWQADGRPANPGRLNDRLHIVYKNADAPWRRTRRHLGVMLAPDLLKENLDGEALDWAWRRLLARHESRRILLMICDGLPHDEATLAANGPSFLTRHLREVITDVENSPVQLAAIGIGHPVGRFYRHAVFLEKIDDLAGTLTHELLKMIER
ncbi:cobaltochelatase CobT-related protein [Desulfobacter vibrioformis]|uniref:cobaltochelatase CobT-related protein n=1 Tax=Desulfobacter vibrioformis TaxID=34031 RepID=UPI00068CB751|nr:hypothetical protein [Desulfobacter vibrioformis]